MAAGLQVTKAYIDQKVGGLAIQVREVVRTSALVSASLSPYTLSTLQTQFGYSAADAQDMLDALYSLGLLSNVANGAQALPTATNMMTGLKKVTGID